MYFENYEDDYLNFLAKPVILDRYIQTVSGVIDYVKAKKRSKKDIHISFDEWNVWYHSRRQDHDNFKNWDWPEAPALLEEVYNFEDVLVVGCILNTFIRRADRVRIACIAQLVNAIAPITTERGGRAFRHTIYYPYLFASRYGRGESLAVAVDAPRYDAKAADDVPYVDVAAVHDPAGGTIALFIVNKHPEEETELSGRSCRLRVGSGDRAHPHPPSGPEGGKQRRRAGRGEAARSRTVRWSRRAGCCAVCGRAPTTSSGCRCDFAWQRVPSEPAQDLRQGQIRAHTYFISEIAIYIRILLTRLSQRVSFLPQRQQAIHHRCDWQREERDAHHASLGVHRKRLVGSNIRACSRHLEPAARRDHHHREPAGHDHQPALVQHLDGRARRQSRPACSSSEWIRSGTSIPMPGSMACGTTRSLPTSRSTMPISPR